MALSSQVKGSLDESVSHLREALAFAARTEHPIIVSAISELICRIDTLDQMNDIMQKLKDKDDDTVAFRIGKI
jgi:hypothetical protein|tara:strand:+ start:1219 stop:1437 length:219 start_codon:yes stop_codon:yes gene_type:complete